MCQQCVKLGIANQVNRKGTIAPIRREKKAPSEESDGNRGRGRK